MKKLCIITFVCLKVGISAFVCSFLYHLMYCHIFFLYQLMALIKVAEHTFLFNFKKVIGCVVSTTMVSLLYQQGETAVPAR